MPACRLPLNRCHDERGWIVDSKNPAQMRITSSLRTTCSNSMRPNWTICGRKFRPQTSPPKAGPFPRPSPRKGSTCSRRCSRAGARPKHGRSARTPPPALRENRQRGFRVTSVAGCAPRHAPEPRRSDARRFARHLVPSANGARPFVLRSFCPDVDRPPCGESRPLPQPPPTEHQARKGLGKTA